MVPDVFVHSAQKIAAASEGRRRAESYDFYSQFPTLQNQPIYTPASVLVTGAAGFIGSHVAIRLAKLYPSYRIIGVDKIGYASDERYVTEPLATCANFRFFRADVCDYEAMVQLMEEHKVDTVLHLAAQSHVDLSFKEGGAQQFSMDNVVGTASLLEAARKQAVRRFIHCSTDEVYGEGSFQDRVDFDEDSRINPNNPYAATKAGADLLVQTFYKSFHMPIIITRGNNVYGPHQFYEKAIPKFIAQLKAGRRVTIHGSGGNTRSFMHVQDAACAFDCILHSGVVGEAYNLGSTNEKTILEVAADILLILGLEDRGEELVQHTPDRLHNDACYPVSSAKLLALGWREEHSWEFGLANTVAWFSDKLRSESLDVSRLISAHPSHSATDAPPAERDAATVCCRRKSITQQGSINGKACACQADTGVAFAEPLDRGAFLARMVALWEQAREKEQLDDLVRSVAKLEQRQRRHTGCRFGLFFLAALLTVAALTAGVTGVHRLLGRRTLMAFICAVPVAPRSATDSSLFSAALSG